MSGQGLPADAFDDDAADRDDVRGHKRSECKRDDGLKSNSRTNVD